METFRLIRRYSDRPLIKKTLPLDADILSNLRKNSAKAGFTYAFLKNEYLYGDEQPRKLR